MPELHDSLSTIGADLLVDCLQDIDSRLENAQQQNNEHITYGRNSRLISNTKW